MIRLLRADERCRTTGIVALSGYSEPEFVERARQAGVDAMLEKPCLPERLAQTVAALASGRKG
jgi:CheY-like chemotaxis protein